MDNHFNIKSWQWEENQKGQMTHGKKIIHLSPLIYEALERHLDYYFAFPHHHRNSSIEGPPHISGWLLGFEFKGSSSSMQVVGCMQSPSNLHGQVSRSQTECNEETVWAPSYSALVNASLSDLWDFPQGLFLCGVYASVRVSDPSQVLTRAQHVALMTAQAMEKAHAAFSGNGSDVLVLVCCVGVSHAQWKKYLDQAHRKKGKKEAEKSTFTSGAASSMAADGLGLSWSRRGEGFCLVGVQVHMDAEKGGQTDTILVRQGQLGMRTELNHQKEMQAVCIRAQMSVSLSLPLLGKENAKSEEQHVPAAAQKFRDDASAGIRKKAQPTASYTADQMEAVATQLESLDRQFQEMKKIRFVSLVKEEGEEEKVLGLDEAEPTQSLLISSLVSGSQTPKGVAKKSDLHAHVVENWLPLARDPWLATPIPTIQVRPLLSPVAASSKTFHQLQYTPCNRPLAAQSTILFELDTLIYTHGKSEKPVVHLLMQALRRQLSMIRTHPQGMERLIRHGIAMKRENAKYTGGKRDFGGVVSSAHHFLPCLLGHRISVLLPASDQDRMARRTRQSILRTFLLPLDRPTLCRGFRLFDQANQERLFEATLGKRLVRVHAHAPLQSGAVSGGRVACVRGPYLYHHYQQDQFDDAGWGCAYRSLQTICSFLSLQGYVSRSAIPTHREIQETLVSMGDKPTNFSGSREWIGAIELSLCLDAMYGIQCKVLNMRSGAEFPSKSREIFDHFERVGTPIMIGGGVLAYTMLGIEWNAATGDVRYLILDPHYIGEDDPVKIVKKGWVGWKPAKLFLKDRFYNLLMPQIPELS